jgi:hypothetical protein
MELVAVSLILRTAIYAVGVGLWVADASRIAWVPAFLVAGEACGIALVWARYAREFGLPRPTLGGRRFLGVILGRGRPVYLIGVSQAVIGSIDLLVVGLMSRWADVGLYSAPHRMATAVLTFGLIFQQVVFPGLARSWRDTPAAGRRALDALVRVLALALVPLAVGATTLAGPLVHFLFPEDYAGAGLLLAIGIWRAPLLTLAYLYQTALIALNRETAGVRLLLARGARLGAAGRGHAPGVRPAGGRGGRSADRPGPGGRRPPAAGPRGEAAGLHHHLAHPLPASVAMVPVCLVLRARHVLIAVAGRRLTYLLALAALGGLRREDLRSIRRRLIRRGRGSRPRAEAGQIQRAEDHEAEGSFRGSGESEGAIKEVEGRGRGCQVELVRSADVVEECPPGAAAPSDSDRRIATGGRR